MQNPIKMDDLEVPLFLETPICFYKGVAQPPTRWDSGKGKVWGQEVGGFQVIIQQMGGHFFATLWSLDPHPTYDLKPKNPKTKCFQRIIFL